jgi:hypothetical protein
MPCPVILGQYDPQPERQRDLCKSCGRRVDDLTDTIFAGHHHPLRVWMVGLYLMGLNLSHAQMAAALDLHPSDVPQMTWQRQGMVAKQPTRTVSGAVACDEVGIIAGHPGQPAQVAKQGRKDGADGSKASGDGARSLSRPHRSSG